MDAPRTLAPAAAQPFPQALRASRSRRRLSQLELALRAGTTQRHISFIENGRSAPGRALVARIADSLALPLRERNGLLLAAGYAPVHPQRDLDDPALAPALEALDHILTGHLPYPAIIVDRYGELVGANSAFGVMTEGADPALLGPRANILRLALHPAGMAPRIRNFPQWARHVIEALREEQRRNPDDRLAALHDELVGYVPPLTPSPGAAAGQGAGPRAGAEDVLGFAVPMELDSAGRGLLRLMTTVAVFATAADVTIAELKLEAFLPADRATADALRKDA
ncbi:MmyB family transcriptional regulator [Actinacidiphila paucisporea]|uniref:DNA-binding transcriptional regulator, XRE-family HTH domain n=1 Tax=Actinacidiphila paucisporea TaxID=310782 RepID=A0A1M7P6H1_9ACTN|nr:helix-turn-helix domain-containing protein [Actinacidiphila paucisporea]SHN12171.1 DNA-binding transcriptional regulator, XRE-family HTH domain [Actinacidiphila paucisporea]